MSKLTQGQLEALADLSDGKWKYGIHVRGRRALPSLRKRGYVVQHYGHQSADQWAISDEGKKAFMQFGTMKHLRRT